MELKDEDNVIDKPMQVIETIPPLAFEYNREDTRIQDTIDRVASFCGYEFTEVPQNPDEEPGVPVPLAENATPELDVKQDETEEGEKDSDYGGNEHDNSGAEKYLEGTNPPKTDPDNPGEEPKQDDNVPNPDLDALREAYKEALEEYHSERASYWAKLWQVIRFISSVTCWTDGPFDTFFTQVRKQNFDAVQECGCRPNCCQCDPDQVVIPLDYTPLDLEQPFIDGWITVMINGEPVKEKIPYEYLNQHYNPADGKLYILRDDFPDTLLYRGSCCCLCRRKLTITLLYNAGYPTIPPGLLPLLCPLMAKMDDAKMGMSDCANAMTQVAGYLKMKKVGNIQYQWSDADNNTQKTLALVTDLYNLASVDEVMALSRCVLAEMPEEIGDVV